MISLISQNKCFVRDLTIKGPPHPTFALNKVFSPSAVLTQKTAPSKCVTIFLPKGLSIKKNNFKLCRFERQSSNNQIECNMAGCCLVNGILMQSWRQSSNSQIIHRAKHINLY
jgi:hypothetical protein